MAYSVEEIASALRQANQMSGIKDTSGADLNSPEIAGDIAANITDKINQALEVAKDIAI